VNDAIEANIQEERSDAYYCTQVPKELIRTEPGGIEYRSRVVVVNTNQSSPTITMGWFEDSDDEDGNGDGDGDGDGLKSKQRQGLLTFDKTDHLEPDHIDKDEPKKSHNDGHGEGDEDVDPLDAYMKALDHSAASKHAPIQTTVESGSSALSENESTNPHHQKRASDHRYHGGRLDVDNEDEATIHWVEASKATSEGNQAEPPRAGDSFVSPNQHANTNTNVDVALESVDHDRIAYAPVRKCLLLSGEKGQNPNNSTFEGHEWRRRHKVSFDPPSLSVDPIYDLQELREVLPRGVLEWSAKTRHDRLTPVQSQTLGVALSGFDAVVTAPTGSGKTLAFLYPVVAHLLANNNNDNDNNAESRTLVLVPTRELAVQVKRVARSLLAGLPWKVCAVTGGHGPGRYQLSQTLEATRPHCWVATPGRLLDVIRCKHSRKQPHWLLTSVTMLVLDEADKLLGCAGFAPQVARILQSLRPDRQSLWVSATFRETLKRKLLQSRCSESPVVRISVGRAGASSENVDQHVVCLPDDRAKLEFLKGLWRDHQQGATAYTGQHTHQTTPTPIPLRTLVFVATRVSAETLAAQLRMVLPETAIETIHGDKHQADRTASLRAFARTGSDSDSGSGNDRFPRVLVATDVAGRGLDIPNVERVVQFDPAKNWDTHVHRIGRAGRLSSATESRGTAYTLMLPSDAGFARVLMRAYEREGRPFPAGLRSLGETSTTSTTGTANTGHRGQYRKRGASGDLSRENGSRQRNKRWGPTA